MSGKIASIKLDQYMEMMEEKKQRAIQFLSFNGYETSQQHGQRISINRMFMNAPEEVEALNAGWNEVFVGKLPRDLFEDELLPILESAGRVYRIRYMMDFSQSNRGFAFVQYVSRAEAVFASSVLDDYPIRNDKSRIGVKLSFDNKCLFFGNLPGDCTERRLMEALKAVDIKGIEGAEMASEGCLGPERPHFGRSPKFNPFYGMHSHHQNGYNRGGRYCYVYFESHEAATQARRNLLPCEAKLFGRKLTCDWAKSAIPDEVKALKETIAYASKAAVYLPTRRGPMYRSYLSRIPCQP